MQCKKCNAEIPEGYMYCPVCGEEIIIVSDFDIKIEDNIDMSALANTVEIPDVDKEIHKKLIDSKTQEIILPNNISDKTDDLPDEFSDDYLLEKRKPLSKGIIIGIVIGAILLAAVAGITIVSIVRYNSFEYQYNQGIISVKNNDYDTAINVLKRAVGLKNSTKDGYILLAECYMAKANYDAAIAVLFEALNSNIDDIELYDRIVECYESQGDSRGIHELIENSNDPNLALRYSDYVAIKPSYSLESGEYVEPDPIKLTSVGEGEIYYTTDETVPTKDSLKYLGPIPLDTGKNVISSIFINEKGIVSEVETKTYNVILNTPDKPVLLVESGNYNKPELIGVETEGNLSIYYTSDGSTPDDKSKKYNKKLLMPLGRSSFCFIAYNAEGDESKVSVGNYNLDINDNIDIKTAEYAISYQLTLMGDLAFSKVYKAEYGYKDNSGTYYIIVEYAGGRNTGRLFAVNVSTGQLYNFSDSSYSLSPL